MFQKIEDVESTVVQPEEAKLVNGPREATYLMQNVEAGEHEEFIARWEDRFNGMALQTLVSELEERAGQDLFVLVVAVTSEDQSSYQEDVVAWSILNYVGDRKVEPLISDWCEPDDKAALATVQHALVKEEQLDPQLAIPVPVRATVHKLPRVRVPPHMDFRA